MLYLTTYAGLIFLRVANAQKFYYPLLAALFLFSAFRFKVGCDWWGYLNQFYVYSAIPFSEIFQEREPLWVGLFAFQNWLGLPYPWINVFSSAIFFSGMQVLARRQFDPLAFLILSFPILIINMPMSGIRQASAIGVMCVSFCAFIDRRTARFVILTLVAAAIHSSAIVFLLLAPLVYGAYSKTRIIFSGLLAVPGALALLATKAAETATSRYVSTGVDAAGGAFRVGLLVATGILFFLFLRRKWAAAFPQDYKLVAIGSLIMLAMIALVPFSSVIGDRLGYYLIPIQTIIFARLPYFSFPANRQLFIASPYLGLMLVLATWVSLSSLFSLCYEPYNTWLFELYN